MAVSRYLVDILTRHQVFLERLKSGHVRDFDKTLRAIVAVVVSRLQASGDPLGEVPRWTLEAMIRDVLAKGETELMPWRDELARNLEATAAYEAEFVGKALREATRGIVVHDLYGAAAWEAAKTHPVQATGKLLEPMVKNWSSGTLEAVEGVLRNSAAQGWTIQDTVRRIKGTKARGYQDGIAEGMRRQIEALVRTSVQHVSNTARGAMFEANADIVTGVRWISTLDNRSCQTCRSLDHRVFPLEKGPRPPAHISCRCVTVSELGDGIDLVGSGTRASKGAAGGEQVGAGKTYYSWLREQPASFQDAAIGKTRGKLLRNGGLSADEFARLNIGRNFEPLTLEEMRRLAPEAFNRAGL